MHVTIFAELSIRDAVQKNRYQLPKRLTSLRRGCGIPRPHHKLHSLVKGRKPSDDTTQQRFVSPWAAIRPPAQWAHLRQYHDTPRRQRVASGNKSLGNKSTATNRKEELWEKVTIPAAPTREQMLALFDVEGSGAVEDHLRLHRDPYMRRYAEPHAPKLNISDEARGSRYPSRDELIQPITPDSRRLAFKISLRLRSRHRMSLDNIYETYRAIPEPRMLRIAAPVRHRLLTVMGTPSRKSSRATLRYFAIVSDVKAAHLNLTRREWNYALALVGRGTGWTGAEELDSVLRLWQEMETGTGLKGNDVTLNILFDVACKAGNLALAETLLREMDKRRVSYDRYHHVSLITFFGLKKEADGIRAAYREMVEAGEMVDTLALNAVIHGLLRCGDETAVEGIFERMQEMPPGIPQLPFRDYSSRSVVTKVLKMFARVAQKHPAARPALQAQVSIKPDQHTYRLLIDYFALRAGDLNRVARYLDLMKASPMPLDGRIFLTLFRGFSLYGSQLGGTWSERRLRGVFGAMMDALDTGEEGVVLSKWMALWALRAFAKCSSNTAIGEALLRLKNHGSLDEDAVRFLDNVAITLMARDQFTKL